jgi:rsbT co-antagonist protein RsbR
MSSDRGFTLPGVIAANHDRLLEDWLHAQTAAGSAHASEQDLRDQCEGVLRELAQAGSADADDLGAPEWDRLRELVTAITQTRARRGARASETAHFVLSLRQPLFRLLQEESKNDAATLAAGTQAVDRLLDQLSVWVMESYQRAREDVIARQQQEVLELSTPVVKLWKGVVALPLIGTLDSERTQVVMEVLLDRINETGARIAIIDITGVPAVDTRVAQHLLQTVAAARLMGADCIISGVRPQIAQTIVHLGLVLQDVVTKSTLADAFTLALERMGMEIVEREPALARAAAPPRHGPATPEA